jgi:hypothetical protein
MQVDTPETNDQQAPLDQIAIVGLYDGSDHKVFVHGQNLSFPLNEAP